MKMVKINIEETKEFINMIEISLLKIDKNLKRFTSDFLINKATIRKEKLILIKKSLLNQIN